MSRAGSCGVMSWVIAFTITLFTVWVPSGAYAQSTASISGVVKDTDGSVMPGVSVVIKNDSSGASQEVTTDAEGRYQATALGAGVYTVTATLSGFKTATAKGIRVAPGQPVTIPLTLEIGQLEETVVVTSSSELINTRERHGRGDAELGSAHAHADADAQRAERGRVPARRQHHRAPTATRRSTACPRASSASRSTA